MSKKIRKIADKLDKAEREEKTNNNVGGEDEIQSEHIKSAKEWAKQHEKETGIKYTIINSKK